MTTAQAGDAKLTVFGLWVLAQMVPGETLTAVYGVINRANQYTDDATGRADWGAVLTNLAQSMNFTGDVFGARIESHVSKKDSVYIEFGLANNYLTVGFKRWEKMKSDKHNLVQPLVQERIRFNSGPQTFTAHPLLGAGLVAPVFRRDGKNFNLNLIPTKKYKKFQ